MTPTQIQECLARANEVLNGFKKPSERNARDVIALIKHVCESNKPSNGSDDFQAVKDMFGL